MRQTGIIMKKIAVFGAKALACGIYEAVHFFYPDLDCIGFVVSSLAGNPTSLCGIKVWDLERLAKRLSLQDRNDICILVATPEDIHKEITDNLKKNGFFDYICMDSRRESALMERYFTQKGIFPSLHRLDRGVESARLCVYQAKFSEDRPLKQTFRFCDWVVPIQVGAALTKKKVCKHMDNIGINISEKNVNYCELTALYWIWKNRLSMDAGIGEAEYFGLFHYRRILEITGADLFRLKENDVDVVLQFPTVHDPDISEHHARYMKEQDWEAMLQALSELQPFYASVFPEILNQPYFYNYNLIIAKKKVLLNYCEWLFAILERTEEISDPKGWERSDRYIGYLGENLMTLYFLYHKDDLKIYHTGRLMLT